MRTLLVLAGSAALPLAAAAHHSPFVHYDRNDFVEIAGVLTDFKWQNPHTQLEVTVLDENGNEEIWLVEELGASIQSRAGVSRDEYQVGAEIRVAGFRGRRNRTALIATNTLLASGRELDRPMSEGPRWSDVVVEGRVDVEALASADGAQGIFRVWGSRIGRHLWEVSYPLTEEARQVQSSWDPIADNPYLHCQNGMPAIMDSGTPIEISQVGETILIRVENLDVVRTVHMNGEASDGAANPYGHSVGTWDDETLVVTTTEIDWPWFDEDGIPQSEELQLVESFTVSEDNLRLMYTITATDPQVFTEPVTLERNWISVPGTEVSPFECTWDREDL